MVTPASHSIGVGLPIKLERGKSLVDILSHLRGASFDIWGGGGGSRMVTYIIGKAYDKNIYISSATKIK